MGVAAALKPYEANFAVICRRCHIACFFHTYRNGFRTNLHGKIVVCYIGSVIGCVFSCLLHSIVDIAVCIRKIAFV